MRFILLAFITLFTFTKCTEKNRTFSQSEITLLPKPTSATLKEGSFAFKDGQIIFADLDVQQLAVKDLQAYISKTAGLNTNTGESTNASISFYKNEALASEAYELEVNPNNINITASDAAGYFYGVQTLKQLLASETSAETKKTVYLIPAITISLVIFMAKNL